MRLLSDESLERSAVVANCRDRPSPAGLIPPLWKRQARVLSRRGQAVGSGACAIITGTPRIRSGVPRGELSERAAELTLDLVSVSQHRPAHLRCVGPTSAIGGNQHGVRLAPVGDYDSLSLRHPLQEPREMYLGFRTSRRSPWPYERLLSKTQRNHEGRRGARPPA